MTDLVHPSAAQRHAQSHLNGYRPDVDGLRALAVLSVLVFHAFPTLLPGGFSFVCEFCCRRFAHLTQMHSPQVVGTMAVSISSCRLPAL